uniref:Uncharacterized protein n=1 Tax=Caenorhabditis japonica TaxID=281687 RepID=A0A8R1I3C2_CAEJA
MYPPPPPPSYQIAPMYSMPSFVVPSPPIPPPPSPQPPPQVLTAPIPLASIQEDQFSEVTDSSLTMMSMTATETSFFDPIEPSRLQINNFVSSSDYDGTEAAPEMTTWEEPEYKQGDQMDIAADVVIEDIATSDVEKSEKMEEIEQKMDEKSDVSKVRFDQS